MYVCMYPNIKKSKTQKWKKHQNLPNSKARAFAWMAFNRGSH